MDAQFLRAETLPVLFNITFPVPRIVIGIEEYSEVFKRIKKKLNLPWGVRLDFTMEVMIL